MRFLGVKVLELRCYSIMFLCELFDNSLQKEIRNIKNVWLLFNTHVKKFFELELVRKFLKWFRTSALI